MGTRTVRLDAESERLLKEIQDRTGATVSGALKRGLAAAHRELRENAPTAYEVWSQLDLGPGGGSLGPARRVKQIVPKLIRRKLKRRSR